MGSTSGLKVGGSAPSGAAEAGAGGSAAAKAMTSRAIRAARAVTSASALLWAPVHLGLEHSDEREIPVRLVVVEAVSDPEAVGDLDAAVVDRDRHDAPGRFVEQGAELHRRRLLLVEVLEHVAEREA